MALPQLSDYRVKIDAHFDTAGIESVITPVSSSTIYNLQGQRVGTLNRGVYIVGGRKVVR